MLESQMDLQLLHRAASAYYLDDMKQADIAERLRVSRPTISKLLTEARRIGMVRFEVLDPSEVDVADLGARLRDVLGLEEVRIATGDQVERDYRDLGALLGAQLKALDLRRGEVLVVSSGKTTHTVSDSPELPELPEVVVAPMVGGQQESDSWFQTNETVRRLSDRTHATPRFIFAPALPSPQLWDSLQVDPSFVDITELWQRARVAVMGVGAPHRVRDTLTSVVPRDDPALESAVGDVCLHFYDAQGRSIEFAGSDRLVRPSLDLLRRIPASIAVAAGQEKAMSIVAGARAGLFRILVTDAATAEAVVAAVLEDPAS